MINQNMGTKDWAMLLLLSFLWGGSFFFIGIAVTELPPFTIVTLRVALAAVTLWLVLAFAGYPIPKAGNVWRAFFVMGLFGNVVPFCLIAWSQTHIGVGLASILNAITPIFTLLIAGTFLPDEHINAKKTLGVIAGLLGVMVLIGPSSLLELGTNTMAQLAVIGATISYACATVYGRRFKTMGISPLVTAIGQVTTSTIILLPVAWLVERPYLLANPSPQVWMAMLSLALFSTAMAYILFFRILSSSGASNVVLVTFLVPVTASFLGWSILGEQLQTQHFIGMALIGLGLAIIDGRLWARLSS